MKQLISRFALVPVVALSLTTVGLKAQDSQPPPPPDGSMDGGQPPDNGQDNGQTPDNGPAPDNGAPSDDSGDNGGGDVSYQTFYDNLSNDGTWIQTDDYGYVFQPSAVSDPNWAPYTDGHWVYSDAGWVWVSDEPWGWATYHYGRWANIDGTGWCWVPGYQWAPAWVSWRYGGGYAGWAPLPPGAFYGGASFHFGADVDAQFGIGIGFYNFVPVGNLGYDNYRGYYVNHANVVNIYNRTTNITNINVGTRGSGRAFRGIHGGGPPIAEVNAHSARPVRTVQLTAARGAGRSQLSGNSLAVYAPRVNKASAHQAHPANVSRNIGHASLRGNAPGRTPGSNRPQPGYGTHPAGEERSGNTHSENAAPAYEKPAQAHHHTTNQGNSTYRPEGDTGSMHRETPAQTEPRETTQSREVTPGPEHQSANRPATTHTETHPAAQAHPEVAPHSDAKPAPGKDDKNH